MTNLSEIKFFTILWCLFMALYFFFGGSGSTWNTAFYCITILMGINNANENLEFFDARWKNVNCTVLKIVLSYFVLAYLIPPVENVITNRIIGSLFVGIVGFNLYRDAKGD